MPANPDCVGEHVESTRDKVTRYATPLEWRLVTDAAAIDLSPARFRVFCRQEILHLIARDLVVRLECVLQLVETFLNNASICCPNRAIRVRAQEIAD